MKIKKINYNKKNATLLSIILTLFFFIVLLLICLFLNRIVECDIKANKIELCNVHNHNKYKISYTVYHSKNNITSNRTCYSECKFTEDEANEKLIEIDKMINIICKIENSKKIECPRFNL